MVVIRVVVALVVVVGFSVGLLFAKTVSPFIYKKTFQKSNNKYTILNIYICIYVMLYHYECVYHGSNFLLRLPGFQMARICMCMRNISNESSTFRFGFILI